jgi:hypothetical protein
MLPLVTGGAGYEALQHRDELLEDWWLARESAPLNRIEPLEMVDFSAPWQYRHDHR